MSAPARVSSPSASHRSRTSPSPPLAHPSVQLTDFYRTSDLLGVGLRPNNRWPGFKALHQRWLAQRHRSRSASDRAASGWRLALVVRLLRREVAQRLRRAPAVRYSWPWLCGIAGRGARVASCGWRCQTDKAAIFDRSASVRAAIRSVPSSAGFAHGLSAVGRRLTGGSGPRCWNRRIEPADSGQSYLVASRRTDAFPTTERRCQGR